MGLIQLWLSTLFKSCGSWSELRSCEKVEVDVLGSLSLIVHTACGCKATLNKQTLSDCNNIIIMDISMAHDP